MNTYERMTTRWDEPCELRKRYYRQVNEIFDMDDDEVIAGQLAELLIKAGAPQKSFHLVIDLREHGYSMPATWDSPAEGDFERKLDEAYLIADPSNAHCTRDIDRELQKQLFDHFYAEIHEHQ